MNAPAERTSQALSAELTIVKMASALRTLRFPLILSENFREYRYQNAGFSWNEIEEFGHEACERELLRRRLNRKRS